MGSNERGAIISAGLTGSVAMLGIGFKLAFPEMIVPFGWALALIALGLMGVIATATYAILWLIQPKSRRQRIQAELRSHYERLSTQLAVIRDANTYEEVSVVRDEMNVTLQETGNWMLENMSSSAFEKFKNPQANVANFSWPGQHARAEHEGRTNLLLINNERLAVLDTFLRYDGWDGEEPSLWQRIARWTQRRTVSTSL